MSGASLAHNKILVNLIAEIGTALKGKVCQILPGDIRVTVPSAVVIPGRLYYQASIAVRH